MGASDAPAESASEEGAERGESEDPHPPGDADGSLGVARRLVSAAIAAWMAVVHAFSWLVARLVAVVLFVVGFVPYGVVMRLIGFDPLDRDPDAEADSFWTTADASNENADDFRKQY